MESFESKFNQNVVTYVFVRFVNSLQFISPSIDSLALATNKGEFELLKEELPTNTFLGSFDKFDEPFQPHGFLWYNSLSNSVEITENYESFALGV